MSDYLIHIEDDKFSSEDYAFLIKNAIPDLSVITISNLPAFIAILPELRSFPPAAILLDLMIPIGDIKEEYPEIDYTDLEGGLACIKLLAEHESTSKIPIIII
jgi:CheY-like chemotaxis protein